jgi:MFS family permease
MYPEDKLSYPGWRVVAICQVGVLTGIATIFFSLFTLLMKPWQQDFGWNLEQISRAFSLAAISVAICSPIMGKLFDRFEPRRLITAMMLAFGMGIVSLAWLTPHLGRLYFTAVYIGVTGTGTYQLGYTRIVASWFERRLGMALSIVVAGSGLGSIFFPPIVQHCITVYGWRHTYFALAMLPICIGAPLTFFFAPSAPTDARRGSAYSPLNEVSGIDWKAALMTRSFWLIALGVCCMSLAENGAISHLAPLLSGQHIKPQQAAIIVSILGGSGVAGRLFLGWILDHLQGSYIAACSLFFAGAGIFLLGRSRSFHDAVIAAVLAGLGLGCEFDLMPYMLKRYFGLRSFATMFGFIYTAYALSGAISPLILGHIYDVTGSYTHIISIFSGSTVLSAFCMLALPAYTYAVHQPTVLPRAASLLPDATCV